MPKQKTDRELINALVSAATFSGSQYERLIALPFGTPRTQEHRDANKSVRDLGNEAVKRLIVRAERLVILRATVKDLKRQLQEAQ